MAQRTHTLRIVFFGMAGATSAMVLEGLLAAGLDVCAVVVGTAGAARDEPIAPLPPPPATSPLPIANPFAERNIDHIAWERGLPAFVLRQPLASQAQSAITVLRPDIACVACFPRRIPPALLALAPHGFLNYHPSLLPAHRGPEPLFWTFRAGETRTGVTIHLMDEGLDSGDIVLQLPLDLPDGIAGAEAERLCAALGGRLMVQALDEIAAGTAIRRPQPPGGSREPSPCAEDFHISATWTARRAFNFMRGTAEWGQPYVVSTDGAELVLAEALAFDAEDGIEQPYVREGDQVRVRFARGVLLARAALPPAAPAT